MPLHGETPGLAAGKFYVALLKQIGNRRDPRFYGWFFDQVCVEFLARGEFGRALAVTRRSLRCRGVVLGGRPRLGRW